MLSPIMSALDLVDRAGYKLPGLNGTQTANAANSAAPSSASLSNSTAGYTTLGGKFQFAAVNGAATDYALFAWQVPTTVPTNSEVAPRLVIKGVSINVVNTGAAVASTATIMEWSLGLNSTAVDLGTTDASPVFATRRIPLGVNSFLVSAGIGAIAQPIIVPFRAGLTVYPACFVHVILQMPVGTNTGSQVIRGTVTFDAYFEPN